MAERGEGGGGMMVSNDPYGAMSAKALLSLIKREPYKRVPWVFNDTVPGKSAVQAELADAGVKLWPNPLTHGELNIQLNRAHTEMANISLLDLTGRLCTTLNVTFNEGFAALARPEVSSGTYLLLVEIEGQRYIEYVLFR